MTYESAAQYVGFEIKRDRMNRLIKITQTGYIKQIINRFFIIDAKPSVIPADPSISFSKQGLSKNEDHETKMRNVPFREAVGSLPFAARVTSPDIEYAVNWASPFLTCYTEEHWQAVKKRIRYLRGTSNDGIIYGNGGSTVLQLNGHTDADYAGCSDSRKSTSGFMLMLNGGPITWSSQRQAVVSLSRR